jgi:hypothetical protein
MNMSFKKMWNDYGIGAIIVLLIVAYSVSYFGGYLSSRGASGFERISGMQKQNMSVSPALISETQPIMGSSIQSPSELLPNDASGQWSELNPGGKGDLANVNLLKAGHHIGIDTVGQSLRNANLQLRSEPPNPQGSVGPWNQTTIEPDQMRRPLDSGIY